MAKKDSNPELTAEFQEKLNKTKLINVEVNNEVKKSFIAYAMAVNVSRAIPDVRDGMKPVHRRILYAMHDMGLTCDKAYKKCAKIVGEVLGKYHPHGDSSVYDALVRLAQDFSINVPLVDGHGNFGSVDGDSAAAYRYTEARLSKISNEMLKEIDKDTVDFYPNFDDTEMQPVVLPSRFPNILVNGSDGIAVGMATNIPPHNLGECLDGCIAMIDNPEISDEELMEIIPAPDYPTGGVLMGRAGIRQAYKTGKGGFVLRAKTDIEEDNNGKERIIVTEIPYQVNKEELIKSIAQMVNDKRVEGISNLRDESDRHGMRIVIELKKDANSQVVLNTLYKHTNLQIKDGIILLALVDGEPKILSLKEILSHYIAHQESVIVRRTKYDLAKAEEREHIVKGLVIALANIDEIIEVIKKSTDKNNAVEALMSNFELSDKQANAILEMRLQRLTAMEVEKLKEELSELEKLIADLKDILGSRTRVKEIIKADMLEMKNKYPSPRKTELSYDYGEIDIEDLIPVEDVVISLTHFGYVKRLPVSEYRTQHRGGRGVTAHKPKEEDFIDNMFVCSTHDDILFFTDLGKVYSMKGFYIPEAQRTARGRAIVNLLQLAPNEKVCAMLPLKKDTEGYMVLATKNGLIKKTSLTEFANIRKTGKIAISILEGDELISVQLTTGDNEIIMASHEGKCIRFSEKDVRPTGRDTQGVKGLEIGKDDYLVDMCVVKENCEIITMTENGYGKRSGVEDYRLQQRSGKGVKAGNFNDKTGKLVSLKFVSEIEDIMVITTAGTIIRVSSQDISKIGRDTQGVRIMRIEDPCVSKIAISPKEDEEGEEIIEELATETTE
ncbi:MAG: DNA gyrase subunit A [Firmicutes bacterium]|nr:DNA gyrase subunit A [Candidatus Caballimonas caccae]